MTRRGQVLNIFEYLRRCPMLRDSYRHTVVLLLLLFVCLSPEIGWAQKTSNEKSGIAVGGFEYKFIPERRMHMYLCQVQKCLSGSKVSYILFAPTDKPNFEEFKFVQKTVVSRLQSRAPQGVVITSEEPERTQDQLFEVFTNTREKLFPNGSKMITKSINLYSKHITISLISSANNKEAADANSAQFMLVLMLLSQLQDENSKWYQCRSWIICLEGAVDVIRCHLLLLEWTTLRANVRLLSNMS